MKNFRKLLIILLALVTAFSLFACKEDAPPCEHADENQDGVCDKCDEELKTQSSDGLTLIEDGEFLFRIVKGNDVSAATRKALSDLTSLLSDNFGIELDVVEDYASDTDGYEVLLGTVTSRGETYKYDRYSLGMEGYAIKLIEDKIIVTGGSDATMLSAFTDFVENTLGITENTTEIGTVVFNSSDSTEVIQTGYKIESVKIGNTDIKGYTIACNSFIPSHKEAAAKLQEFFYSKAGYYLPIVPLSEASEASIIIRTVEKGKAGDNGFRVETEDSQLIIECAHNNMFSEAFEEYYSANFAYARDKALALKEFEPTIDISIVYYSEFGAVGDGKVNDFLAIKAAHEFANEGGQTVFADRGAVYLIGDQNDDGITEAIPIRTDTNWNGAKFIFDDRYLSAADSSCLTAIVDVFNITNDYNNFNLSADIIANLNASATENGGVILNGMDSATPTTKLDLGLGYPAMLELLDANNRQYIRWGYVYADLNSPSIGSPQREVIHIDAEGNIDPSTPLLFDYEHVSSILVHRTDVTPITVQNGVIESIASRINLDGGYKTIRRGINVSRPHTTLYNLQHIITGEIAKNEPVRVGEDGLCYSVAHEGFTFSGGDGSPRKIYDKNNKLYTGSDVKGFTGHSYHGFVNISKTHDVLIKKVVFQARVYYEEGTYDIGASASNKIVFEECSQSNFFDQRPQYGGNTSVFPNMSLCWGVSGTNFCKNMDYIKCKLTRYDAHCGVVNGKIIDSEIAVLRLIGGGDFIVENTTVYCTWSAPFQLRSDYGCTFNGTLTIKDCTLRQSTDKPLHSVIDAVSANWDFGYVTYFPNIIIDNLAVETKTSEIREINLVSSAQGSTATAYPNRSIYDTDANGKTINDPDANFPHYFNTYDANNSTVTIVTQNAGNLNPYVPPKFIKVINNDGKNYKLVLYNTGFFNETDIQADSSNLTVKNGQRPPAVN